MDTSFVVDGRTVTVKMRGRFAVNDVETFLETALRGLSIVQAPNFMTQPHLDSGALVEVLGQWKPAPMPISAVYPQNRHLSPAVRTFVDWAADLFARSPLTRHDRVDGHEKQQGLRGSDRPRRNGRWILDLPCQLFGAGAG